MSFGVKRRVWIGLAVAMVATGGWVMWTRRDATVVAPAPKPKAPFVVLTGTSGATGNQLLREKAALQDPTPLFFPTEWNYGQRPLREKTLRQPDQVFASFAPMLTVSEQTTTAYGAESPAVPEKLSDVLVQGNEAPFAGFGQVDQSKTSLPVRAAFVEVRAMASGDVVIKQSLTGVSPPRSDYAPVEFLVAVGPAGLISEPLLASGSGWDEVDNFFRDYLVKAYRLGGRLPPGQYRVFVGA